MGERLDPSSNGRIDFLIWEVSDDDDSDHPFGRFLARWRRLGLLALAQVTLRDAVKKGEILLSVHCDTSEEIKPSKEVLERTGGERPPRRQTEPRLGCSPIASTGKGPVAIPRQIEESTSRDWGE